MIHRSCFCCARHRRTSRDTSCARRERRGLDSALRGQRRRTRLFGYIFLGCATKRVRATTQKNNRQQALLRQIEAIQLAAVKQTKTSAPIPCQENNDKKPRVNEDLRYNWNSGMFGYDSYGTSVTVFSGHLGCILPKLPLFSGNHQYKALPLSVSRLLRGKPNNYQRLPLWHNRVHTPKSLTGHEPRVFAERVKRVDSVLLGSRELSTLGSGSSLITLDLPSWES